MKPTRMPAFVEFVALMALMMGITSMSIDNMLPALGPIADSYGITDNSIQFVIYAYMFGFGTMQLVYGPISDVVGRRSVVLGGLAIFSLGSVLAIMAPTFDLMLAARIVQGMGAAACRVLVAAIVRDRFEGREMARVMSLTMMVFIIVPVIAPAIGSFFLLFGSWHFIFISTFVVGLMLAAWFGYRMPETLHPEYRHSFSMKRIADGFRQTVTTRVSIGYATCASLVMGSLMAYVGGAPQILETDVYNLGPLFPIAFGCIAASMGVGALINSRLVRRYGMRRLSQGAICMCIFMAALQIVLAVIYDGKPPLLLFCGGVALIHFFFSLTLPNFNAMALQPMGAIAGTASSFVGFFTTVFGAICGLIVGQSFNGTVLPLVTGFFVLNTAALLVILWTERGKLFTPQNPDPVA